MRKGLLAIRVVTFAWTAAPARAAGPLTVGIGDQKAELFGDPRFGWLGLEHARLVVPWYVGSGANPEELAHVDRWLQAARRARIWNVDRVDATWDSGLIDHRGRARPGFDALARHLRRDPRRAPALQPVLAPSPVPGPPIATNPAPPPTGDGAAPPPSSPPPGQRPGSSPPVTGGCTHLLLCPQRVLG